MSDAPNLPPHRPHHRRLLRHRPGDRPPTGRAWRRCSPAGAGSSPASAIAWPRRRSDSRRGALCFAWRRRLSGKRFAGGSDAGLQDSFARRRRHLGLDSGHGPDRSLWGRCPGPLHHHPARGGHNQENGRQSQPNRGPKNQGGSSGGPMHVVPSEEVLKKLSFQVFGQSLFCSSKSTGMLSRAVLRRKKFSVLPAVTAMPARPCSLPPFWVTMLLATMFFFALGASDSASITPDCRLREMVLKAIRLPSAFFPIVTPPFPNDSWSTLSLFSAITLKLISLLSAPFPPLPRTSTP